MPWTAQFPGVPESVGAARRLARKALGDDPRAEDAELIVSELVTNAILHSRSGTGGKLWIEIRRHPDSIRIEVADEGGPDGLLSHRTADEVANSGRGLAIVNTLADAWGAHGESDEYRSVWVELASRTEERTQSHTKTPTSTGV